MIVVIFKAQIKSLDSNYTETVSKLRSLAEQKYGCLQFVSFTEGDKEFSISYWPDEASVKAWKQDPAHLEAQVIGQSKWYKNYQVEVLRLEREYGNVDRAYD